MYRLPLLAMVIGRIVVRGHWLERKKIESERKRGVKADLESPPLGSGMWSEKPKTFSVTEK